MDGTHIQLAPFQPVQFQQSDLRLLQFVQDPLGVMEKGFPGRRQADPLADAVKKERSKFLFELLDLLGEGRLGDVQGLGGTPEMEGVGHGQEVA